VQTPSWCPLGSKKYIEQDLMRLAVCTIAVAAMVSAMPGVDRRPDRCMLVGPSKMDFLLCGETDPEFSCNGCCASGKSKSGLNCFPDVQAMHGCCPDPPAVSSHQAAPLYDFPPETPGNTASFPVKEECGVASEADACGCDGERNSSKVYDRCGVCGGRGDCFPFLYAAADPQTSDLCGIIGGTDACVGCDGVPYSTATCESSRPFAAAALSAPPRRIIHSLRSSMCTLCSSISTHPRSSSIRNLHGNSRARS
jgi:hypothetical protein